MCKNINNDDKDTLTGYKARTRGINSNGGYRAHAMLKLDLVPHRDAQTVLGHETSFLLIIVIIIVIIFVVFIFVVTIVF
jgi:hypothetical protein